MNGKYATPNAFLRMCIDCDKSRIYQATNQRTIWYFCIHHGVMVHYNESCEDHVKMEEVSKPIKQIKEFTGVFDTNPPNGKAGVP